MDNNETNVEFRYTFAEGYRLVPANGALGGPTTRGDYRIEFFVEAPRLVEFEQIHLDSEGRPVPNREPAGKVELERRLTTGVVLSIVEAQRLAAWILERTAALEKQVSERGNQ